MGTIHGQRTGYPLVLQPNFHKTAKYHDCISDPASIPPPYDGRLMPPAVVHTDPKELRHLPLQTRQGEFAGVWMGS